MTFMHLFWGGRKPVSPRSRLSIFSKCLIRACCLFLAPTSLQAVADDTASVDAIIDAYYEVISGPVGFVYDAERDENIHAPDAVITKFFLDGTVQQHDFKTEQASIVTPYETPFFEFEVDRKIEQFGNIAHVWSEFEMKTESDGDAYGGGFNSISLLFLDGRWWISSWSTQYKAPGTDGITTSAIGRLGHERIRGGGEVHCPRHAPGLRRYGRSSQDESCSGG